ncbi:MAG: N-acetylglucosamine-6-phosphate deacetylase [Acholeplasmatales bacterium]|nr:MAG: N-acetylglucosamine-6-phosphate deacetylase [Acholeplasmatales bacterium]
MRFDHATLVLEDQVIENGHLIIEHGKIAAIGEGPIDDAVSLEGRRVFPGFIDMHIHGADGADFMDGDDEAIGTVLHAVLREGTTAVLATTMTQTVPVIERALDALGRYKQAPSCASMLGIHLEGPFLSTRYPGAQNAAHIVPGDVSTFKRFQALAKGKIRLVTLAPEVQSATFLDTLVQQGIIVSIGHSDATHDQVVAARARGIRRVTHCYNAMRGLHHRDIGVVGSALLYDDMDIELIADLHHVSVPALSLAAKLKPGRMQLVTDSVAAKYGPEGTYQLGGQTIVYAGDTVKTTTGTLAGSVLRLCDAARNMHETTGMDLPALSQALSGRAAELLGLADERGRLAVGLKADLAILDPLFQVYMTIIDGRIVYKKGHTS